VYLWVSYWSPWLTIRAHNSVTFVTSFTDPGASQCWHFGGIVSVSGFVDRGIDVNAVAMRPR
jgi:hypothetical protein